MMVVLLPVNLEFCGGQEGLTWKSPAPWSTQPVTESMRRVGSILRTNSVSMPSMLVLCTPS
jgi:hypothetical protein